MHPDVLSKDSPASKLSITILHPECVVVRVPIGAVLVCKGRGIERLQITPTLIGDGPISGGQDITTIALFDDSLQAELWSDVLDVIPMRPASDDRNPTADEIAGAARDAERFLDLIGMLASSRSAFLLDSNYQGVKSDEKKTAFLALDQVVDAARSHSDDETGWGQVRDLLRELGAELGNADSP